MEGEGESEALSASKISRPSPDHHGSPAEFTQSLSERKQKYKCFKCGQQGHWAEDCLSSTKEKDKCFKCGKQGHWAKDCLSSTPTKAASSPEDIHQLPVLRCYCGVTCTIRVSHSDANPGRKYYVRNCDCDGKSFFQWCDEVTAPMCKCGAGACTINIQRDNEGKDTKYYTCRIGKGHGSCGFLQFDSAPNSQPRSPEKDKLTSISSPQHDEPPDIMTLEDERPIPSSANGDMVVPEAETCDSVMGKGHRVSHLMSRSDVQISARVECRRFDKHLTKSVQNTSSVAKMDSTLQDNCNLQGETINKDDKYLDCISGYPAEEAVHKVASMLRQIERLENLVLDVVTDVRQSKRSMQATYQELTESLKLHQDE
ncbi:hypothetical protein DITRI_Ditri13aG0142000 [Diplodiscus trichospermus]